LHPWPLLRRGPAARVDRRPPGERRPLRRLSGAPHPAAGLALLLRPGARFPEPAAGGLPGVARRRRRPDRSGGLAAAGRAVEPPLRRANKRPRRSGAHLNQPQVPGYGMVMTTTATVLSVT